MKHFNSEDWTDFAGQVAPPGQRETMQRHLDQGCEECSKDLQFWRSVRDISAREAFYEPPESALRIVKAYALRRPPMSRHHRVAQVRLIFDSLQAPMLAGARTAGVSPQQLIYKAGPLLIVMRLEPQASSDRISLVGQIFDSKKAGIDIHDVPVTLVNQDGGTVRALTNQFGEFHLESDGSGALRLSVGIDGDIEIPISVGTAQAPRWPWISS